MSNHELLRRYLREDSQAAFAALVSRHVDLVYSAALRQVRLPHLAEEVAQAVFVDLARQARTLPDDQPLSAWLYVVTRRTAIDVVRREVRRRDGEQSAATLATMRTESAGWTEIAAVLDEAMAALDPIDRSAILLRFFENLSLREVGESLGISEDTAQKRVSRAVDRLRTAFAGRGVAVSATAFAAELSAHAVQAAPAGLGAAISSSVAVSSATAVATAIETSRLIAMTTLQKSALAVTLALVLGAGSYEVIVFAHQKSDLDALDVRTIALAAQLDQARAQQNAAASRLKSVEAEIDARLPKSSIPVAPGDAAMESQMKTWLANLDRLRGLVRDRPSLAIPEFQLLTEETWFSTAASAKLATEEDIRRVFGSLRSQAENLMANRLGPALGAYLRAHNGILPGKTADLLPHFDPPIEPELLDRYELQHTGNLNDLPNAEKSNLIAVKSPVDVEHDGYWRIGPNGFSSTSAMSYVVGQGQRAFAQAHNGQRATIASDLLPYLKWPVNEAALQKYLSPLPSGTP